MGRLTIPWQGDDGPPHLAWPVWLALSLLALVGLVWGVWPR